MTDFTTNGLLYPFTKGDVKGHNFHGNQYEQVASSEKPPVSRPPVGKFQLSESECEVVAKLAKELDYPIDNKDKFVVAIAKMLGMDKPATLSTTPLEKPNLFRGCDRKGAESLTQPLTAYGQGGGISSGPGVYTSSEKSVASQYKTTAVRNGRDGVMVEISTAPYTKVAPPEFIHDKYSLSNDQVPKAPRGWSKEAKAGWDALNNYATPSLTALVHGYQAVEYPFMGHCVILDRSVMTVYFR